MQAADYLEATADPECWIVERGRFHGDPYVTYTNTAGQTWRIIGSCIACGECEVGSDNPHLIWTSIPVGQMGACLDDTYFDRGRLDVPVSADIAQRCPHCTLRGERL